MHRPASTMQKKRSCGEVKHKYKRVLNVIYQRSGFVLGAAKVDDKLCYCLFTHTYTPISSFLHFSFTHVLTRTMEHVTKIVHRQSWCYSILYNTSVLKEMLYTSGWKSVLKRKYYMLLYQ